jgi:hypothetical protein
MLDMKTWDIVWTSADMTASRTFRIEATTSNVAIIKVRRQLTETEKNTISTWTIKIVR